jgi:hypothetical protein
MKSLTIYLYRSPEYFVEVFKKLSPDYQKAYNSFRVLPIEQKNEVMTLMYNGTLLVEALRYPDMLCIAKAISNHKVNEKIPQMLERFVTLCAIDAVANRVFLDKVYSLIRQDQVRRAQRIENWQKEKEEKLAEAARQFVLDHIKNKMKNN